MSVVAGDTFLGDPRQLGTQVKHLWVVVAVGVDGLDESTALAVLVSVTSIVPQADKACVVDAGDHPFVRHQSFMYYQKAAEVPVADLSQLESREPVSASLLSRIRQGLHLSRFTPRGIKRKVPLK